MLELRRADLRRPPPAPPPLRSYLQYADDSITLFYANFIEKGTAIALVILYLALNVSKVHVFFTFFPPFYF